jgi:hypothetical protein
MVTGCGPEPTFKEKDRGILLTRGEWANQIDTVDGISIRLNKIAFYKDNQFTSDDIYEYQIIDSVIVRGEAEEKLAAYLKLMDFKDTVYHKIIKLGKEKIEIRNSITGRVEEYKLKH